jgi:hypothetical protein
MIYWHLSGASPDYPQGNEDLNSIRNALLAEMLSIVSHYPQGNRERNPFHAQYPQGIQKGSMTMLLEMP